MIPSYRSLSNRAKRPPEPLPHVPALAEFYRQGVNFRQGQLAMVVGRPGSQKSGFAMWLTAQWGLPTLYFAADMGEFVASERDACIRSGLTSDEVRDIMRGPSGPKAELMQMVREASNLSFVVDPNPSLDDIDEEIEAWVEMYDSFPAVIVLDNLMDLEPINESEYASNKAILLELKTLTRNTNAFVLALHHNREEGDPGMPAPAKQIQGKVSQTPELVLSVALQDTVFRVAAVKQRSGPADPTGGRYIELLADPARTSFSQPTFYQQAIQGAQSWQ